MKTKPGYFAVLSARVRYAKDLSSTQKLVYAELTALTQMEGYCWASNEYLSDLFEINKRSMRRLLSDLEEKKYIKRDVQKGCYRKIFLTEILPPVKGGQKCPPPRTKMSSPPDKNVPLNNITKQNIKYSLSNEMKKYLKTIGFKDDETYEICRKNKKPVIEAAINLTRRNAQTKPRYYFEALLKDKTFIQNAISESKSKAERDKKRKRMDDARIKIEALTDENKALVNTWIVENKSEWVRLVKKEGSNISEKKRNYSPTALEAMAKINCRNYVAKNILKL